jgi:DNA-binding CsgD family transcriptional regulator
MREVEPRKLILRTAPLCATRENPSGINSESRHPLSSAAKSIMQSTRRSPPASSPHTAVTPVAASGGSSATNKRSKAKGSRAAYDAMLAQLRIVGELDSQGRHFLIVEASSREEARRSREKANGQSGLKSRLPMQIVEIEAGTSVNATTGSIARILTQRELQIAALVSAGSLNKQIALTLAISEYTVSTHIRRIFSKLGIKTRSSLASIYTISQGPARRELSHKKSA